MHEHKRLGRTIELATPAEEHRAAVTDDTMLAIAFHLHEQNPSLRHRRMAHHHHGKKVFCRRSPKTGEDRQQNVGPPRLAAPAPRTR